MEIDDIFFESLPKIDLHGFDRDSARIAVNDFVDEGINMGYSKIIIIHGIGSGIVREAVHYVLSKNKKVFSYHLLGNNIGCTIVELLRR